MLSSAGALAGVALAYVAVRLLLIYGASKLPRLETVAFDAPVLLFAMAMLLGCALGVGLAPVGNWPEAMWNDRSAKADAGSAGLD